MMKKLLVFAAFVAVLAVSTAWADDLYPPEWRGQENTTRQEWGFGDGSYDAVLPDSSQSNPPLTVSASLTVEYNPPDTVWIPSYEGRDGVWRLESPSDVIIDVPNYDIDNPLKEIWIQLTYIALEGREPFLVTNPMYTSSTLEENVLGDDGWYHATYSIILEPNPPAEIIWIQPADCTTYVDQVVVDTICVPEPVTVCLLGLGALALLRKRRP